MGHLVGKAKQEMALDDIVKFQLAMANDDDLRARTEVAINSMTSEHRSPLTNATALDWSAVTEIAGEAGADIDGAELHSAVFSGGSEWTADDLVDIVGAGDSDVEGFRFNLNLANPFQPKFGRVNSGQGLRDDTIHGVAGNDTIHGRSLKDGLGQDTIHG